MTVPGTSIRSGKAGRRVRRPGTEAPAPLPAGPERRAAALACYRRASRPASPIALMAAAVEQAGFHLRAAGRARREGLYLREQDERTAAKWALLTLRSAVSPQGAPGLSRELFGFYTALLEGLQGTPRQERARYYEAATERLATLAAQWRQVAPAGGPGPATGRT
ncbi:hypothetical protein SAMN06265365_10726 [Tistlia consotensis]|uniref:Flagellar protein FliS n=1 Tax=Tistlia consotensis USBA 355 TaxID=560819 RepID=A0A1Y6BE38_9PROT|nr:hypothetical protein [Tistlia consotensis]SME96856.1 hypothetical protein SAMN05428998_10226 [Tistlia consotensis USBA 355]SNR56228.1 hypothetical protein SAMN06265365_10726 [Tistlia consotensis]